MDQVDLLLRQQPAQPPGGQHHGEGILAAGGKLDPHAAFGLEVADEVAGGCGDQRPRAALGQRRRDIDRGAVELGVVKRRHDLQDGASGEAMGAAALQGKAVVLVGHGTDRLREPGKRGRRRRVYDRE